jgi:hypothetical protein
MRPILGPRNLKRAADDPGPASELPRGSRPWPRSRSVEDEWGRSESLDPDNVGDIADEGAGHRG